MSGRGSVSETARLGADGHTQRGTYLDKTITNRAELFSLGADIHVQYAGALGRSGRVFCGAKEECVALAVDEIGLFNNRMTRSLFFT
jgi:hypothetical protein